MGKVIRVVVVEDHPLMLDAVVERLNSQPDIEVVGTANHGNQLFHLVRTTSPNIVVLDIGMSGEPFEPVTAIHQLKQTHPDVQVLVLTGYEDEVLIREFAKIGVQGYLLKSDDLSLALPQAVRKLSQGERFYSNMVVDTLLSRSSEQDILTEQELAVLRLAAQGLLNTRIAQAQGLSEKRVRNLLTSVYAKLDVRERDRLNPRISAINKARELGILPED